MLGLNDMFSSVLARQFQGTMDAFRFQDSIGRVGILDECKPRALLRGPKFHCRAPMGINQPKYHDCCRMTDSAIPFNRDYFVFLPFIRSKEFGGILHEKGEIGCLGHSLGLAPTSAKSESDWIHFCHAAPPQGDQNTAFVSCWFF
jgi:hypothetical protein